MLDGITGPSLARNMLRSPNGFNKLVRQPVYIAIVIALGVACSGCSKRSPVSACVEKIKQSSIDLQFTKNASFDKQPGRATYLGIVMSQNGMILTCDKALDRFDQISIPVESSSVPPIFVTRNAESQLAVIDAGKTLNARTIEFADVNDIEIPETVVVVGWEMPDDGFDIEICTVSFKKTVCTANGIETTFNLESARSAQSHDGLAFTLDGLLIGAAANVPDADGRKFFKILPANCYLGRSDTDHLAGK